MRGVDSIEEEQRLPEATSPLKGVKVLELGHIVAGPSAGMILADFGADVIKIEQPGSGDAARNMPNYGSTFYFLNRNKRSLALDLKSQVGVEVFEELITGADVVFDNFAPGQLDRWGVGYDWAASRNPGIIYCSIKGFLPGPYQSRPFLDELAQMAGGLAYMTGPIGQPLRAGASVIDIGAATYATLGVMAALMQRTETGKGQLITAGLFETAVFWVGQHIARTQLTGKVPEPMLARSMGGQMGWGVYQTFETADERQIFVAVTSNGHWERFCRALDLDDFAGDPDLATNRQRVEAYSRITPRIAQVIAGLRFEEVSEKLEAENVPYAPVNNPRDLLDDPHLNRSGFWMKINPDGDGELVVPRMPIESKSQKFEVRRQPPRLGEHSREILLELGHPLEEIAEWEQSGWVQSEAVVLPGQEGDQAGAGVERGSDS